MNKHKSLEPAVRSVPDAEMNEAIECATLAAVKMLGHTKRADADDVVGDCLAESLADFDPSRGDFKTYLVVRVRNRIQDGWKADQKQKRKKGPTMKEQAEMYERDRVSEVGLFTSPIETLAETAQEETAKAEAEPFVVAAMEALRGKLEQDYPLSFAVFVMQETSPVRLSTKNLAERLGVTRQAIRAAQKVAKYHFEKILGELKAGAGQ